MATIALKSVLTQSRNGEIMSKALDIQNNTQSPHQGFQIPLYTVLHLFFQFYFPSHTQANSVISRDSGEKMHNSLIPRLSFIIQCFCSFCFLIL